MAASGVIKLFLLTPTPQDMLKVLLSVLAMPKSVSLMMKSLLIITLLGLISLWIIPSLWIY